MQYMDMDDVPDRYIVDVSHAKPLAEWAGKARLEDAVKNNTWQKSGFVTRSWASDARSVLTEIGVCRWLGLDEEQHVVLFEPRVNGRLDRAKGPDIGNVEVRNNGNNFAHGALAIRGKDYLHNAIVIQTCVETVNDIATGRIFLLGWNNVREDWPEGLVKPTRNDYYTAYTFNPSIRRSMDDFDRKAVVV